uniref:Uncharacterized protein n=1 Tax=Salix viminalis TaxID=40686 RepID=A0A6N2LQW8_SALVM
MSTPVLTSKMGVSSRGFHLKNTLLYGQKRDIKSTTTQIKNQHVLLAHTGRLLIKTISDGSSRRLIDDTHHVQTCNNTGILGGLPLRVIEVCRDGNNSILDSGAERSHAS